MSRAHSRPVTGRRLLRICRGGSFALRASACRTISACRTLQAGIKKISLVVLCAGAAVVALAVLPAVTADRHGFTTTVTAGLLQNLAKRFGVEAKPRIANWTAFAKNRKAAAVGVEDGAWPIERLQVINSYMNTVPWFSDMEHWGSTDYWATPAETVGSHGADCEDYAIAKYFLLKELGVPVSRLRITYVRATRIDEPHMVLAYYSSASAEPLILDNLDDFVRSASTYDARLATEVWRNLETMQLACGDHLLVSRT